MCPVFLSLSFLDGPVAPWAALSAGVLAVIYLLLRKPHRRGDPLSSPPGLSLSQQRAVERDMNNLLVELSEMARQISAQLDNRATKLELLIKDADDRIAQLRASMDQPSAPPGEDSAGESPPPPAPANDPRHEEVYRLADEGRSARQIADDLGRPNGEIELILALRAP